MHVCFAGSQYWVVVEQCVGTSDVQLPSVHYTLGGNAIRGAGTWDLFREHREEHQTQKTMGLSKDEGEK